MYIALLYHYGKGGSYAVVYLDRYKNIRSICYYLQK